MGNIASDPCTDTKERSPLSPASSSSQATPYAIAEVAGAAVSLEVHAQQPEAGDLRHQLAREGARLEVLADQGEEAVSDEVADGRLDHPLLAPEKLIDRVEVRRVEAGPHLAGAPVVAIRALSHQAGGGAPGRPGAVSG